MPANQSRSSFRNSRTTDGRPICNLCHRVGHYSSRCFTNSYHQNSSPLPPPDTFRYQQNFSSRPSFNPSKANFQNRPPLGYQPRYHQNSQNRQNFSSQNYSRDFRFPALPPPPPPPPRPLHIINGNNNDGDQSPVFSIQIPQFRFAHFRNNKSPNVPPASHVCIPDSRESYYFTIPGTIEGIETNILIDTGAALTAINLDLWNK